MGETVQERLRTTKPTDKHGDDGLPFYVSRLFQEAADLIDTLIKERDEARARRDELKGALIRTTALLFNGATDLQKRSNVMRLVADDAARVVDPPTVYTHVLPPTAPDSEVHNDGGMK